MYTASDGFLYPPVAAAFFGLFGFIGTTTLGGLLWCAINMFVYLVAILLVYRSGVLERVSARAGATILLLLLLPSLTSLSNGQCNGLMTGSLLAAVVALQAGIFSLAAACATLPVLFKIYPRVFGAPISDGIYFMFQIVTDIGIAGICLSDRLAGWSINKLSGYAFAFSCMWMTLLGPVTEKATYMVIAPLLCWLILDDRQRNQNK